MVRGVYKILENPGPRAEPVYSNFPGPGRFLVPSVYRKPEEPVYSNFHGSGRLPIRGVYRKLEEPDQGRTSILKNS